MSDMYEKLGDLLNNVLESGEIPQNKQKQDQYSSETIKNDDETGPFSFENSETSSQTEKKSENTNNFKSKIRINYTDGNKTPTGSVIKDEELNGINMHKYTKIMHIPCIVSKSLDTLNIVCIENLTLEILRKQYHQLLKENHPDTANKKGIFHTPDELKNAYEIVKNYLLTL